MRMYVTVVLLDGESLLRGFDTDKEAIEWLREKVIPRQTGNIASIHVDRTE